MSKKTVLEKEKLIKYLKSRKRVMRPGQIARMFNLKKEEKEKLIFLLEEIKIDYPELFIKPPKIIKECLTQPKQIKNDYVCVDDVINCLNQRKKNCLINDISRSLNLSDKAKQKLDEIIEKLVIEGKILRTKFGICIFPEKTNLVVGPIKIGVNGNGFVKHVVIDNNSLNGACNGDIVLVETLDNSYNDSKGIVRNILKRMDNYIPFKYENGTLIPYGVYFQHTLNINPSLLEGLENGDRVGIKLSETNQNSNFDISELILIAKRNDPAIEYKTIAVKHGFDVDYTKEELEQVYSLPTSVSDKEMEGRTDFRNEPTITIDGEKTKDIDDGFSFEKLDNGCYIVKVHIMDITNYIEKNSPLHERAKRNANTLYLMNEVFHMFHHTVANGICSMNEGVDRLSISGIIKLNNDGEIMDYELLLGVVQSKKKMTNVNVNKYLDEGIVTPSYEPFTNMLDIAKEISDKFEQAKIKNGYLQFANNDPDFDIDENGKIKSFKKQKPGSAEKLVENAMIMMNICMADYLSWFNIPYIKRIHEHPDGEKVKEIIHFINTLGYKTRHFRNQEDPKSLQIILKQLKDVNIFPILSEMLLRTMKRAEYSLNNIGHYGLALKNYVHSTAGIRRVTDVETHYLFKELYLNKNVDFTLEDLQEKEKYLSDLAKHASNQERRSENAEREAEAMEMAALMEKRIGEYINGRIINISPIGVNALTVDGIYGYVRFKDILKGNYRFDQKTRSLTIKKGTQIKIGDAVRLKVTKASKELRIINFKVVELLNEEKSLKLTK